MGFRFFPKTEIHEFDYQPLFYDEVKDRIEQRRAEIRAELDEENAEGEERTRYLKKGTFTRKLERRHEEKGKWGIGRLFTFRNILVMLAISLCIRYIDQITDFISLKFFGF